MKKFFVVMVVLMLATSAWARVDVTCAQTSDTNEVVVSYNITDANKVRAFALNISVDNNVPDSNFSNYFGDANIVGTPEVNNSDYYIFPGSINIIEGDVNEWGSAIAERTANSMIIEMGSLYDACDPSHTTAPPSSGWLLKFNVNKSCIVTITENAERGGVVVEDTNVATPDVNLPSSCIVECMKPSEPNYANWIKFDRPDCWCYPRQCYGDADGTQEYGTYWVFSKDLDIFKANFSKQIAQMTANGMCADFNHDIEYGTYWVFSKDLDIFKTYFSKAVSVCPGTDYHFWTEP